MASSKEKKNPRQIKAKSKIYPQQDNDFLLPSCLGDDHFCSHFIKLRPKFPVVEEDFDSLHPLQQIYKQEVK